MTEEAITCTRDTTIDILGDAIKDDTIYNVIDDQTTINIFDKIWPIGSLYFGIMETCPLAALFGTWEKVSSGRVLQGADENHLPGTTIEAGLPNITGRFGCDIPDYHALTATGAFYGIQITPLPSDSGTTVVPRVGDINPANTLYGFDINASRSNHIYGNADTVQPAAFVVNIWQRTA